MHYANFLAICPGARVVGWLFSLQRFEANHNDFNWMDQLMPGVKILFYRPASAKLLKRSRAPEPNMAGA
jgi:hypothetical protein